MKKVFGYIDLIAQFHAMVLSQNTGTPGAFADRLGISRSSVYNLIEEIKSYGIEIEYSRTRQTFKYRYPEKVEITISIGQRDK